jgi:hypothetical protein
MTKKKLLKNIVKGAAFVERMECIDLIDKRQCQKNILTSFMRRAHLGMLF